MDKRYQLCTLIIVLFILFLFLTSFKEGMLQVNHAIDVSGILHDDMPPSTKIQMISMIGINEPEDPIFYNLMIDASVDATTKVTHMNKMIDKYFNVPPK
jgi:hypothetical protein